MDFSEENDGIDCLGVFFGWVWFFGVFLGDIGCLLKVLYMGWNQVQQVNDYLLWVGIDDNSCFYFVYSYCVIGVFDEQMVGCCEYGLVFVVVVVKCNVFVVQFYLEKSVDVGFKLLENFLCWWF